FAPDDIALRVPEDRAVRLLLEVEQVHLRAELAMVALGGFLEPMQMRIELLLVEPAGAVDAREHRVFLIAPPVSAGNTCQLERLRIELAGRGEMRPPAHVEPVSAGPIDRQLLMLRQFGRPFGLEALALLLPAADELFARPDFALERL